MKTRALLFAAGCGFLLACGGGDPATVSEGPAPGIYALTSINGQPLPVALGCSDCVPWTTTGGGLDLRPNGYYRLWLDWYDDSGFWSGSPDLEETGVYTTDGNTIRLYYSADAGGTWPSMAHGPPAP